MNKVDIKVVKYVQEMRKRVITNAKGLPGHLVARALMRVTDSIYDAGIDASYPHMNRARSGNLDTAYDLIWLVPLAIELHKLKSKRK